MNGARSESIRAGPAARASGWLLAIVLCALVLRLGWSLTRTTDESALFDSLPDQREYVEIARNLLAGKGLTFHDPRFDDDVHAFRAPGYPLFLAMCGGNITVARIAQSLLGAAAVFCVYVIARRWLPPNPSLLAAALVAVNPFLIYFTGLMLSETLFVALLCFGVNGWVRTSVRPRFGWVLVSALLLAAAVLVRPGAALLPFLLAWLAVGWRGGLIALVVTIVALGAWGVRNASHPEVDAWVFTTTNGGITLYDGVRPGADGSSDQRFVREMPQLSDMSEVERDAHFRKLAAGQVRENPLRFAVLAGLKIARTWSPWPLSDSFGGRWIYLAIAASYAIPFFVATAIGVLRSVLSGRAVLLLLAPAVYLTLIHAASVGSLRYRIPAEPLLAVLAGAAIADSRHGGLSRHGRRADDSNDETDPTRDLHAAQGPPSRPTV